MVKKEEPLINGNLLIHHAERWMCVVSCLLTTTLLFHCYFPDSRSLFFSLTLCLVSLPSSSDSLTSQLFFFLLSLSHLSAVDFHFCTIFLFLFSACHFHFVFILCNHALASFTFCFYLFMHFISFSVGITGYFCIITVWG